MSKNNLDESNKINPNKLLNKWLCCGSGTKKLDRKSKKLIFGYEFDKKHNVTKNLDLDAKNDQDDFDDNFIKPGLNSNEEKKNIKPPQITSEFNTGLLPTSKEMGRLSYRERSEEFPSRKEEEPDGLSELTTTSNSLPEMKCKSKLEYFKFIHYNTEDLDREGEIIEESYQIYPIKTSADMSDAFSHHLKKMNPQEGCESFIFKIRNNDTGEIFDIRNSQDALKKISASLNLFDSKRMSRNPWGFQKNEKKVASEELLSSIKENNFDKCMGLLRTKEKAEKTIDFTYLSDEGFGALHYACMNGNQMLCNILLHYGAPINHQTINKQTPLMICSQKGFEKVAYLLMVAGARINQKDIFNNTALHYAVESDSQEIVDLFLGVETLDVSILNDKLLSAADLAKSKGLKEKLSNHSKKQKLLHGNSQIISLPLSNSVPHLIKSIAGEERTNDTTNSEKINLETFNILRMIGRGSFGEVFLIEKKFTKKVYAMKVLSKEKVQQQNLVRYVQTERNILQQTSHPFIVKLKSAFQNTQSLFLIMNYYPGGDLGKYLGREKKFSEDRVRLYITEIILAIEHLHEKNIIFRDLKPENVLVDAEGHIAITDFGLSKQGISDWTKGTNSFCGSIAYLSPEVVNKTGHGKAVDWYLLGVMMYEMLVGIPPYFSKNRQQMIEDIKKGPLKFPKTISDSAKSLMIGLLQRNPAKRLGSGGTDAEEIKNHLFFQNVDWVKVRNRGQLMPSVVFPRITEDKEVVHKHFSNKNNSVEIKLDIGGWSFEAIDFSDD